MPINLCRTFLSLKTSFLIIFCKKNCGTNSTKNWNMTAARTCETAHVQCHRFIFPRAIFCLSKRPLFHIFKSFLYKMNFSAIFPMYLGTTKATSKKNQVQRCFRFPGILLSQDTYNDTHYEIIGVDIWKCGKMNLPCLDFCKCTLVCQA